MSSWCQICHYKVKADYVHWRGMKVHRKCRERKKWPVKYVYGNFRTARAVAEKLRGEGKQAWAEQASNGNCVVRVKS